MTVVWISDYPVEWMADLPEPARALPKGHTITWMPVLLEELARNPAVRLHVVVVRKTAAHDFSFERNGVTFHILKVRGGLRAPSLFWTDTRPIQRLLREIKPDLVHAWGSERGAALIASRLGYPYVVTIQGLLTWYRQLVPLNLHEHFAAWLEHFSLKRAGVVTTESAFAVDYLQRKYPRMRVHQAEHASNWLFHGIERRPQTQQVRFITVGTLGYRKGTDLLLRALNRLTPEFPFEMVVVGSPTSDLIETLKPELSPELWRRVTFKKGLTPAEVAAELAVATISVLPTRADTSPNAVKEAVVAGVPVVASRIGGIPDYVFPGENGLLFDSGDLEGFVAALRAAARHPLFGQGRVDAACWERTRAYLSPKRMEQRFLEAYQLALEQKAGMNGQTKHLGKGFAGL